MGERVRAVTVCAYAGAGLAVLVPVLGGLTRDGYSQTSQFISELGERGAPHGLAVSLLGFLPTGLIVLAFGALAVRQLRGAEGRRLLAVGVGLVAVSLAIGYAVSGVARCQAGCPTDGDTQQAIHNAVGYVEYGVGPIGLLVTGWAARRLDGWRGIAMASVAAAIVFFVLAPLVEQDGWSGSRGTLQRILEALLWGWVALVGHRLARAEAPGLS